MSETPPPPPPRPPDLPIWLVGGGMPQLALAADAVCLIFSREEVCALRVGRGVDDLMHLLDDESLRIRMTQGLFFAFDGWEKDPREVHEIPECRAYLQALHSEWPYWLHFLAPDTKMWGVLLLCLLQTNHASANARNDLREVDMSQLHALLESMLEPMNLLHRQMRLSSGQSIQVFDASIAAVQGLFK